MLRLGLQLYTVRDRCEEDFLQAIRDVAAIGYRGLEFAGYYGVKAEELRALLDSLGLEAVNSHVALSNLEQDLKGEIEFAKALGMKTITVPFIPPERQETEEYKKIAKQMAEYAPICADSGLQLCYHNHDFEFEKIEDEYVLDYFLRTVPDLKLELDTFWTSYAGLDTVAYIIQIGKRMQYLHLKDMIKDDKPVFAEVGEGCLNYMDFVNNALPYGVEWAFVEQDVCAHSSMESAKISFQNATRAGILR